MALAPMYFIVSLYLMQAALQSGKLDMPSAILSIAILVFALYLVFAAFFRALPESLMRTTYLVASSLAVLGSLVFLLELIKAERDLMNLGLKSGYVNTFLGAGLLVVLGIMVFHLISLSSREW